MYRWHGDARQDGADDTGGTQTLAEIQFVLEIKFLMDAQPCTLYT